MAAMSEREVRLTGVTGDLRSAFPALAGRPEEALEEVWQRNPITGERMMQRQYAATPLQVATFIITSTGYQPGLLDTYQVSQLGGRQPVLAEQWLESHPIEALIAAWTSGTAKASEHRRDVLHDRWPALAKAIDNVQDRYDEGR